MQKIPESSVDAIVCDPPYGLRQHKQVEVVACLRAWLDGKVYQPKGTGFMGQAWDAWVPGPEAWKECLRILKPGGHALVFAGTRSLDLMCMALRLSGFELRDSIGYAHDGGAPVLAWVYGSGMPKGGDISKIIDRKAGVVREDKFGGSFERRAGPTGNRKCEKCGKWLVSGSPCKCPRPQDAAVSPIAKQWEGFSAAIRPAWDPIILARKPLDGTIADNVIKHGTGVLNIGGCRIERGGLTEHGGWPANVVLDEASAKSLDEQTGTLTSGMMKAGQQRQASKGGGGYHGNMPDGASAEGTYGDSGGASRFFYCAKASRWERDVGLADMPVDEKADCWNKAGERTNDTSKARNHHPAVKPVSLMRWLVRLVTHCNGIVLDPFAGSGTTGMACVLEKFDFIGFEKSKEYVTIAERRIAYAKANPHAFDAEKPDAMKDTEGQVNFLDEKRDEDE
jgi:site-specific DNA-methyltransferase (adenine-specific)